jgi:hypothetical protein
VIVDLKHAVERTAHELFDAFRRDHRDDPCEPVAGDPDLVSGLGGLRELDLAGVAAVAGAERVAERHPAEPTRESGWGDVVLYAIAVTIAAVVTLAAVAVGLWLNT